MKFEPRPIKQDGRLLVTMLWCSRRWCLRILPRVKSKAHTRNWYAIDMMGHPHGDFKGVPPELRVPTRAAAVILLMRLVKGMESASEEEAEARWKELACQLCGRDVSGSSAVHLNYVDIGNLCHEV